MIISKLIEELKKLPQELNITVADTENFKSDFNILNGQIQIPIRINDYDIFEDNKINKQTPFIDNVNLMCDLICMCKDNFLKKYNFITSLQYDLTKDIFYSNKEFYLKYLYDKSVNNDVEKALKQTQFLEEEILLIKENKRKRGVEC